MDFCVLCAFFFFFLSVSRFRCACLVCVRLGYDDSRPKDIVTEKIEHFVKKKNVTVFDEKPVLKQKMHATAILLLFHFLFYMRVA